jgi:hypothetical protein
MTEYLVTWQIFVEARTPQEAARTALTAQRDVESHATCFDVSDEAGGRSTVICPAGDAPARPHLTLVKTSRG